MAIEFSPTPATWQEAVERICNGLSENEKSELREHGYAAFHHGVGTTLRNRWQLWDESTPLAISFKEEFGITHADDLSGILLQSAEAIAHGRACDYHGWANVYKEHWENYKN